MFGHKLFKLERKWTHKYDRSIKLPIKHFENPQENEKTPKLFSMYRDVN